MGFFKIGDNELLLSNNFIFSDYQLLKSESLKEGGLVLYKLGSVG